MFHSKFASLKQSLFALVAIISSPVLLITSTFASELSAAQRQLNIDINGHYYNALLRENFGLSDKLSQLDENSAVHYLGELQDVADSWVRVSLVSGRWQGVVSLGGEIYIVDMPAPETVMKSTSGEVVFGKSQDSTPVKASKPVDGADTMCGTELESGELSKPDQDQPLQKSALDSEFLATMESLNFPQMCNAVVDGVCLLAELELAFDEHFSDLFVFEPESQALSIINIVEGFYINDLKIAFESLTITFASNSQFSSTTNASSLLSDLRSRRSKNQFDFLESKTSFFHLITGRNLDGRTAGIAYLDSACSTAGYATGLSSVVPYFGEPSVPITALVMAHELGHNLGADHDGSSDACPSNTYIMSPTLRFNASHFSSCSINSIENHIATRKNPDACFSHPFDTRIEADEDNVVQAVESEEFTLNYDIVSETAETALPGMQVKGTINDAAGIFHSVSLEGNGCKLGSDQRSYVCEVRSPQPTMRLQVNAVTSDFELTLDQQVEAVGVKNGADIHPENNSLETYLAVELASEPPAAPSKVVAEQSAKSTNITLRWQDNSDNESSFVIERSLGGDEFHVIGEVSVNTTEFVDTTAETELVYAYRVFSSNSQGDSEPSNIVKILVSTPEIQETADISQSGGESSGGGGSSGIPLLSLLSACWLASTRKRQSNANQAPI